MAAAMKSPGTLRITVSIGEQRLRLLDGGETLMDVPVSTALNGPGERMGSECTPRGRHVVRAKIGDGAPAGSVFIGRRATGEIFHPRMRAHHPDRDWILTRLLWLSGSEPGRNRLGDVDTMRRFIYIHGCPDDVALGAPGSHGCVRMGNSDVVALFDQVPVGTPVLLEE
jgi:lipoprotein-anchoring transpeptidase ErfK/SrfK